MALKSWDHTPIVSGKDFCISVSGTLKETLRKGSTMALVLKLVNDRVYIAYENLCDNSPCPLPPGPQTLKLCAPIYGLSAGVR